jgi:hypothetical protein
MAKSKPRKQNEHVQRKPVAGAADAQREQFAHLLHSMVLAFQEIRKRTETDNAKLRSEWRDARGLAAWIEERLEVTEARIARLEQCSGCQADPEVEKLRAILANYKPSLDALGVKSVRRSMTGSRE